ncbi:oligosaccharide flippase family protein [Aurantiacibacter suaedae]|uniref:oligosaccharide flippase family protein n=1 Tax=Aurantiacibacter suaedae TaxID=2545755 RepID=UPI0010F8B045|nr:oligosaccharide flippase family protein [Aurantiacibacter suaedae]
MFARTLSARLPNGIAPIAKGLVAYGSAEAATRIVRILAILVIARRTSPELLGTAALALTLFELIRVLANAGIGQRIIAATDSELAPLCNTARRLFWAVCLGVAGVQLGVAAALVAVWDLSEAALMLAALSGVYACMPPALVQVFLLMRDARLTTTARIGATQTMADHCLTLALVVVWPSAWAIVLPKLLTAPVWTILTRRARAWVADPAAGYAPVREFSSYGPAIFGSELIAALRIHADKLVIGALLGSEALGLYYFAFNAGLGITLSFVAACNTVIFPLLCKQAEGEQRARLFRQSFALGLVLLAPVVAAQALLAPFYVPLVFGPEWIDASPYIALLSLAALPLYAGSLIGAWFRAQKRPLVETRIALAATVTGLGGLAAGSTHSLTAACAAYAAGLALVLLPAAIAHLFSRTFHSVPT